MGYPIRQYVCLVDCHRRPSRRRNTYGRYLVGAKTAKEARRILQNRIGFGSVIVVCEETDPKFILSRGKAVREVWTESSETKLVQYVPVLHATAPQQRK